MSDPSSAAGDGDSNDNSVAKTAGIVVFSGIAMSILKALNPFNKHPNEHITPPPPPPPPLTESTQLPPPPLPPNPPLPSKIIITSLDENVPDAAKPSRKMVEIEKGDTLWGLSREYGVSIDAIKEANGLTGDTIYAGKKLIIP